MMNTKMTIQDLGPLSGHVQALRDIAVSDRVAANADIELRRALSVEPQRGLLPTFKWLAPALAATLVVGILLIGGPFGPKPAFAQVQRYFADFQTLHAKADFAALGMAMFSMDVYVQRGAQTRIDMNDAISHIIDPQAGTMMTLDHKAQTFHVISLPSQDADAPVEGLDWLHRIRDFQGQAEVLPNQRTVRGILANGFRLDQDDSSITIWAAASDNRPLTVEMATGPADTAIMTVGLFFDQPLSEADLVTDPPTGYRPSDQEADD